MPVPAIGEPRKEGERAGLGKDANADADGPRVPAPARSLAAGRIEPGVDGIEGGMVAGFCSAENVERR